MNEIATVAQNSIGRHMTSREIAELTNKEHRHVMRDIKSLIDQGAVGVPNFGLTSYVDPQNKQEYPMYSLNLQATMVLITGYDAKRRSLVIDRWMKLETGEAQPAMLPPKKKAETVAGKYRETEGVIRSLISIGKMLGTEPHMAKAVAVEDARQVTGIDCKHLLPAGQVQEAPVGVRALAKLTGIPEKKITPMLCAAELAIRDAEGAVSLTEKARDMKAGSMEPFKAHNGHVGYQPKWFPSIVVPVLQDIIQ